MECEEEGVSCHTKMRPKSRGHIGTDAHIYKNVILVSKITKNVTLCPKCWPNT